MKMEKYDKSIIIVGKYDIWQQIDDYFATLLKFQPFFILIWKFETRDQSKYKDVIYIIDNIDVGSSIEK